MPTVPQLLDFAHRHPNIRGGVEDAIRAELGVTPARYCVLLERAAASMEGQAYDPVTAHRVLRARKAPPALVGWGAFVVARPQREKVGSFPELGFLIAVGGVVIDP